MNGQRNIINLPFLAHNWHIEMAFNYMKDLFPNHNRWLTKQITKVYPFWRMIGMSRWSSITWRIFPQMLIDTWLNKYQKFTLSGAWLACLGGEPVQALAPHSPRCSRSMLVMLCYECYKKLKPRCSRSSQRTQCQRALCSRCPFQS